MSTDKLYLKTPFTLLILVLIISLTVRFALGFKLEYAFVIGLGMGLVGLPVFYMLMKSGNKSQ